MSKDPIVDEVRRARESQAAKHDFDINAILSDAQKRQRRSGRRVVSFARKNQGLSRSGNEAVNNVAVAEKLSALRTEDYFRERAVRADLAKAKRILKRAGKGKRPVAGDEIGG